MVAFLLDVIYVIALVFVSPWLLLKAVRTRRYRAGLCEKLLGTVKPRQHSERPCVWFHAVSVGEVLMLRRVVSALIDRRRDIEIVVSTTTNTGMEVAQQHFAEHHLIFFPLDFSWSVHRSMRRIRPDVVALAELELWPNFIAAAQRFGARIAVINGRMSPRSLRGYRKIRPVTRYLLGKVDALAVQTHEYASRFLQIGSSATRIHVTGSVKYDGVETDRNNPRTAQLRNLLPLKAGETIWVAGSTSEPEEELVLDVFTALRERHTDLRLVIVPRHKERFEEVARLITARGLPLVRRSRIEQSATEDLKSFEGTMTFAHHASNRAVILIDTLGELSAVWGLAEIAFVGGTFAPRGGQNMIEPAGYGAAVTLGPGVWNFQETVDQLLARGGAVQVASPRDLERELDHLLSDPERRRQLGNAARHFVLSQRGATDRTVQILCDLLDGVSPQSSSSPTVRTHSPRAA